MVWETIIVFKVFNSANKVQTYILKREFNLLIFKTISFKLNELGHRLLVKTKREDDDRV